MQHKRSILLLAPATSIHTQRWALGLIDANIAVTLVSCSNQLPKSDDLSRAGVAVEGLPFPSPWGYILNRRSLKRLVQRTKPDLLHAHFASGYGTLGASVAAIPTLLSVWGTDVYDFPGRSPLHRRLLTRNLHAYDALTSTSHAMRERTLSITPDLADRITVVPFGVDVDRFRPVASTPDRSRATVRLGTCKALQAKYGVDVLIQAFADARRHLDGVDLELHIAGDGPQQVELEALARRLNVDRWVSFLGRIENSAVPGFLNDLDIFCALSDSESFGVAVVEAMAVGLPTIVSDVDGFAEVTTAATSLSVRRRDVDAASVAIQRLATGAALRQRLGDAGRARVMAEYDWRANVEAMVQVYERLWDR